MFLPAANINDKTAFLSFSNLATPNIAGNQALSGSFSPEKQGPGLSAGNGHKNEDGSCDGAVGALSS